MTIRFSPHAQSLLHGILGSISDDEIHILSIRHGRMLVAVNDTFWN